MRGFVVMLLAVAACNATTDPPVRDAGPRASSEIPDASANGGSFNPDNYPTDCEEASDCIKVPHLTNCVSCCAADTAVNREPAARDVAAASGACQEQGRCALECPDKMPACVDKRCVLQASDAGSP